jgi:hypothetical protein
MYEHNLRPAEKQHNPWIARITIQLLAACRSGTGCWKRPAAAVPDQVAVTSTVIWTFIQSTIPHVVHAGDFNHIRSVAELYETHSAFKKHPFS